MRASRSRARSPCSATPPIRFLFVGSTGSLPRFFQRSPHGRRLAARFGPYDQVPGGLSPPDHCSCWAHHAKRPGWVRAGALLKSHTALRSPVQIAADTESTRYDPRARWSGWIRRSWRFLPVRVERIPWIGPPRERGWSWGGPVSRRRRRTTEQAANKSAANNRQGRRVRDEAFCFGLFDVG